MRKAADRERDYRISFYAADIAALKQLLDGCGPDEVIVRVGLEHRLRKQERKLAELREGKVDGTASDE